MLKAGGGGQGLFGVGLPFQVLKQCQNYLAHPPPLLEERHSVPPFTLLLTCSCFHDFLVILILCLFDVHHEFINFAAGI